MAIQLGQAFISLHADGAALAGEVRAQVEAAMAEAQAAAGIAGGAAAGTAGAAGVGATTAAADEAAASLERMGAAGATAGTEIVEAGAEADAALARMIAAGEEATASWRGIGAAAVTSGAEVSASADRAVASTGRMAAATGAATKSAGLLGMSWKSIGEIAGAIGVYEAIKAAGHFQQALTRLVTSANESQANIAMVGQSMLDMGSKVGFGANDLAKGMYIIESAGYHGAAGVKTLTAAAEIARQENADLVTTAQAVTTTMRDFGIGAGGAATVASKLNEAVAFGKTNLQDFSAALHSVEPNAAAAHLKMEDVLGDLATMTNSGMSAQQAAQNLAHTLSNFEKPSQPMINALASIGLNTTDLTAGLSKNGLAGTLIEVSNAIKDHLGPAGDVAISALNQNRAAAQSLVTMMENMPPEVAKLSQGLLDGTVSIKDYRVAVRDFGGQAGAMGMQFLSLMQSSDGFNSILKSGFSPLQTYLGYLARSTGTVDALRTALLLTSDGGKKVTEAIQGISAISAQADGNVAKWSLTQKTFNQRFDDAKAAVENFGITMGNKVLPVLGGLASWVADKGVPALQNIFHWFGQLANSEGVIGFFGFVKGAAQALGGVLQFLGNVIGTLIGWFTSLPGPIQTAILIFAGLRVALATDFFGLFAKSGAAAATAVAATGTAAAEATGPVAGLGAAEGEAAAAATEATTSTGLLGDGLTVLAGKARTTAATVVASTAEMRAAYAEAASAAQFSAGVAGASAAEMKISGAMAGIGGAARSAGGAITSGFGKAMGGAMSMLGGPWGIAMIAGIGLFMQYQQEAEEVKQALDQANQAGADLAATYVQLGTVDGTAAMQARELALQHSGLSQAMQDGHIEASTMTDALRGQSKAMDQVQTGMKKADASDLVKRNSYGLNFMGVGMDVLTGKLHQNEDAWKKMADQISVGDTKQKLFDAALKDTPASIDDIYAAANKVWGPNNVFQVGVTNLQRAMEALPKAGNDVAKETQALDGIWAHLGETAGGVAAAQVAATDALDATGKAFQGLGVGALDAKGNIDLTKKAGADLYQNLQQIADGAKKATDAAFTAAGGNAHLAASTAAAGKAADTQYQAFLQAAAGAHMNSDAAAELAAKLGILPGKVTTAILQPGMNEAQAGLAQLQKQNTTLVKQAPYTVSVKALTQDAITALDATGYKVTHMPDGTFQITANTRAADSAMSAWLRENSYHVVTVGVRYTYTGTSILAGTGTFAGGARALGGIDIAPMAFGGLIDQTMAQFVSPQSYRLVGDRMSADEAFIPLDGSPRSLGLWAEAGRRMGQGAGPRPIQVTYAPQYNLPPSADPTQVAAMVGANTARDFQLGIGSLSSLGMTTG